MVSRPLRGEWNRLLLRGYNWRAADPPDRRLHVLRSHRSNHVLRCQIEACEPLRIEPDAHSVILLAEH